MSGRSHSHVEPLIHELEGFMDMMSRGYVYIYIVVVTRCGK
jgi:hypothetical protein